MSLGRLRATDRSVQAQDLLDFGLMVHEPAAVYGRLEFERPGWIFAHRLKNCSLGAFTFFNAAGQTSAYCCHFGRYSQIGESSVLGPPEHPMDWFSNHPFAFGRPQHLPSMYRQPEFARLAPDAAAGPAWVEQRRNETIIGHEAYIGAGCFVKRGVEIGAGAVVGARSTVTRDVPPFAIVAGSPARFIRWRFPEAIIERLLALKWWHYDLAPYKTQVDFSQVEATLEFFEARQAAGELQALDPETYTMQASDSGFAVEPRQALYSLAEEDSS